MTKHKTPDTLTETQLEETRGGRLIGLGTTVVSEVSTDAVAATTSGMSTSASAGANGGATLQEASPRRTKYIGGPPAIDKARHSALLSTVRNLLGPPTRLVQEEHRLLVYRQPHSGVAWKLAADPSRSDAPAF